MGSGVVAERAVHAWPRGMRAELAADYCGLSVSWLTEEARRGRFPASVRISPHRVIWLKDDLDRWLDEKAGRANAGAGDASGQTSVSGASSGGDALSDWDRAFGGERAA